MTLPAMNPPFAPLAAAVRTALVSPVLVAGAKASGTLTFSGVVADGQIVTIGAQVYEFDTAPLPGAITPGRVRVDVSAGVTAPQAVTALVAAITGDAAAVVTAVDGALDTVVCTAKVYGTAPNAYPTTTTCGNASWGAVKLAGGTVGGAEVPVYAPVAPVGTAMPYIIMGEDFGSDWGTKDTWGTEHRLRFHVWDQGKSAERTDLIMAGICGRIVNASLTIGAGGGTHTLVLSRYDSSHVFLEDTAAGPVCHGVLDIRALVSQG